MIRNLLTLIAFSVVAIIAKAATPQFTAAVYDDNGNFLDIMTVEVDATPEAVTFTVPGSEIKGSLEFALPMNEGDGFLWLKGSNEKARYMIVDNDNCSLRFAEAMPQSVSDFKYALSFDPKDWATLRSILK
ncbi:MAG: hypothetical protein K2K79_07045 [Paramuribaculum sp.]|nr:hypothetical protein [Paramuribaculum sp.]